MIVEGAYIQRYRTKLNTVVVVVVVVVVLYFIEKKLQKPQRSDKNEETTHTPPLHRYIAEQQQGRNLAYYFDNKS